MGAIQQFFRILFAAIEIGERARAVQYRGPEALQALAKDFRHRAGIDPEAAATRGEVERAQPQRGHAELRHRHHPLVLGDC